MKEREGERGRGRERRVERGAENNFKENKL